MATTADRDAAPQSKFKVLGTRPVRHDGIEKVTGAARYGADMLLPGTIHGKVLRSPYAHARIRSIDTSKAEAMPGVRAVATSADFPIIQNRDVNFAQSLQNPRLMAENDLADKKVLYKGPRRRSRSGHKPPRGGGGAQPHRGRLRDPAHRARLARGHEGRPHSAPRHSHRAQDHVSRRPR